MIVGIAGTIGAGKGTVVEYLIQKGFSHYSSSDTLRGILTGRGLPHTRVNLSALADELLAERRGGVLAYSFEQAQKDGAKDMILEAIHRMSEADYVRSIGGVILGVDADLQTRYDRIHKRQDGEKDNVTFEQFSTDARNEDDGKGPTGSNIRSVLASVDATITNNGTVEELRAQVDEVLAKIQK
ncbi:MAG: hypothetical protein RLZZ26_223 [Candidatus Parcubacteria bacterium]|jgi:dephospho-CoA kinase